MPIQAVIADDEPLARRGIRQMLARHPDIAVLAECRDGRELLQLLERAAPDLVFLDIRMPELDGFEVIRSRGVDRMPRVVFVTAFDDFAVRAFETGALDYIVKPVNAARFDAAMRRARERLHQISAAREAARLGRLLRQLEIPSPRLAVAVPGGRRMIELREIAWIESEDYFATLHTAGARHLIREPLSSIEARLPRTGPGAFVRVHRGALVRLESIRELRARGDGAEALLATGDRVAVSRRRRPALVRLLRLRQ